MIFRQDERVCLFIDGANLYSASRNLGFDVDYRNLLGYFRARCNVLRAYMLLRLARQRGVLPAQAADRLAGL